MFSCKGLQYYENKTNPSGLSILFKSPPIYYYNINANDSLEFFIVNHNSAEVILPHWWSDLWLVGKSRFYNTEFFIRPQPMDLRIQATTVQPNDTVSLIKIPLLQILTMEKNWICHNKPHSGPHYINKKTFQPYIKLMAEYRTMVPNQQEVIKIRSGENTLKISSFSEEMATSKLIGLGLSADYLKYDVNNPTGNLICKINNGGTSNILLFNDAGSVRFKFYAYNPNRTSIMSTEMVLDNGKLPISQLTIQPGQNQQFSIPMEQLFFMVPPAKPIFYWTWKHKKPPISPMIYNKRDLALETECWFGIVSEGKEYLSNTIKIEFTNPKKMIKN